MEPMNCLALLRIMRQFLCKDLVERGREYVQFHFVEVLRHSEEFIKMTVDDLADLLSADKLNVRSEETVFEAVRQWVEYERGSRLQFLPTLFKTVRLGHLTAKYLQSILEWPPIIADVACKKLIGSVGKFINVRKRASDAVRHPLLRPRVPHDILFAIGGWADRNPNHCMETYDSKSDRWLVIRNNYSVARAYHGICALEGIIYLIGGYNGIEHFSVTRAFDPATFTWRNCACMYYPRCFVSVATHAGKVYAIGGFNGQSRMDSAERYDPKLNEWQMIQPMQEPRSDASAATLNEKIYIVGGFNGRQVLDSAEVYDTDFNQWSHIPNMISARSGVSLVAFRGTLFAIGGFNGFTRLSSGERFTPLKNTCWNPIADMYYPRSNFSTVVLDDYIFAIGGFNGATVMNHVECYDPDANRWLEAEPMHFIRSGLSACVLSGLKNAKEYSFHGHHMLRYHN